MTCSPGWAEITENLKEYVDANGNLKRQLSSDRPDLLVRVFDLKRKALLEDLMKRHVFGRVRAYVYVIEFQKRGLPHMYVFSHFTQLGLICFRHMLITLEDKDKLTSVAQIDKLVSAEIPDEDSEPVLHRIVKENMIHGPCVQGRFPCNEIGRCNKNFPKPFRKSTVMSEDVCA